MFHNISTNIVVDNANPLTILKNKPTPKENDATIFCSSWCVKDGDTKEHSIIT